MNEDEVIRKIIMAYVDEKVTERMEEFVTNMSMLKLIDDELALTVRKIAIDVAHKEQHRFIKGDLQTHLDQWRNYMELEMRSHISQAFMERRLPTSELSTRLTQFK